MISSTSENLPAGEVVSCPSSDRREPSSALNAWPSWPGLLAIFVAALGLSVWFNFFCDNYNCTWSCDAAEYLRNAQAMQELLRVSGTVWGQAAQCLVGAAGPQVVEQVRQAFGFLHEMHQSAPVFPLFIALACKLAAMPIQESSWSAPVLGQCLLSSVTCSLVALIGFQAWDRKTGYLAGLLAAFYPAFIVNSGRMYSESFAVFLLAAVAWITVRGQTCRGNGVFAVFLNGCAAAALQMTRSVMSVISVFILVVTFVQARRAGRWVNAAALVAGLATVTLPWLALQGLAFGKMSVIVDRVGHYNFFTGNNADSGGWLSYPYAESSGIDKKSYLELAADSVQRSPARWLKLMADKPVRLFKFPWNDFRVAIGPVQFQLQVVLHQLLLLMAAQGLVLAFLTGAVHPPSPEQVRCRWILIAMLLPSLAYLFFITVPRYNLTAMPIVILFSAAGALAVVSLIARSPRKLVPLALVISSVLLFATARMDFLPLILAAPGLASMHPALALLAGSALKGLFALAFLFSLWLAVDQMAGNRKAARLITVVLGGAILSAACLPVRAHGRWWEWHCPLTTAGNPIEQRIEIPEQTRQQILNTTWYLMVDSESAEQVGQGMKISVNGHIIDGPVVPSLALVPDMAGVKEHRRGKVYRECEYIFDCLTRPAGISNSAARQWFLIPIPAGVLARTSSDQTAVVKVAGTGKTVSRLFGSYPLAGGKWNLPSLSLYSWEKAFYGVENDTGLTDTRYDIKVAEPAARMAATDDLSPSPGRQFGAYNLRLLAVPTTGMISSELAPALTTVTHENSVNLKLGGTSRKTFNLELPDTGGAELLLATISGQVMRSSGRLRAGIDVASRFSTGPVSELLTYQSPWACRDLRSGPQWTPFALSVPIVSGAFPGKPHSVSVQLYATGGYGKRGEASETAQHNVTFRNVEIQVTGFRINPLSSRFRIY